MTPYATVDTLYTIAGVVLISTAGETARRAGVGHMQVHAAVLNLRDLPSIIPNHPTHAQRCFCTVHGPISLVTVCDSALLAQVAMREWLAAQLSIILASRLVSFGSLVEPAWVVDSDVF